MAGSFLAAAVVALAAGCAAAGTAAPASRSAVGVAGVAARATPRQRAAADARAILGSFVPPPGLTRLARRPRLPGGWARYPAMGLSSVTQADAIGYWRGAGLPAALLAWERRRISRRFSGQDVIIGPPSWDTVYSLPAVPGVLAQREMNVQAYAAGGGTTVIMAEAMVAWPVPRPAAERIPAGVQVVTIAASGPWPGHPAPVTIAARSVVRRLAALVNRLPLASQGRDIPCPMAVGVTLTFRRASGPPAAVAAGPAECGVVHLTLGGHDEPDLQPPGSYRAAVLKIAGLPWKLG